MRSHAPVRRLAPLLLALAPLVARASSITATETGDDNDQIINIADCQGTVKSNFSFSWAASSSATSYGFWVSNQPFNGTGTSGCSSQVSTVTGTKATNLTIGLTSSGSTVTYPGSGNTVTARSLMTAAGLDACNASGQQRLFLCVEYASGSGTTNGLTDQVTVDFTVPGAPANVGVDANDSALNVHWDASTDTTIYGYRVFWNVSGDGSTLRSTTVRGAGTNSNRIEGLQNGTPYDVQVAVLSNGRNPGTLSAVITQTPVIVYDLWRTYKQDGGQEQGGCSTGAGGLLALLGVAPFAFRRGRRS